MAISNGIIETSLRDILNTVFRHKWKIILITLIIAAGVTAYTYAIPEMYESEAKVLVKVGRNAQVDPTVTGPTMPLLGSREAEVKAEIAILKNRDLFERVVDEIGAEKLAKAGSSELTGWKRPLRVVRSLLAGLAKAGDRVLFALDLKKPLTPRQKAIQRGMDNLSVEAENGTTSLTVTYQAADPELAEKTLDLLLELYRERHIEVHASNASPEFFEGQTSELLAEVNKWEEQLGHFKSENGIVSLESQKDAILERIVSLDGRVDDVGADADGSRARLAVLEDALEARPAVHELNRIVRNVNPVRDNLKEVLVELRNEEAQLASLYPDTNRHLQRIREQISRTEEVLEAQETTRTEVTTGINSVHQDLFLAVQQEKAMLESKLAAHDLLKKELEAARQELDKLAGLEIELRRYERNLDTAITEYEEYRDNLMRSRISTALDKASVSNVSVAQPPSQPLAPVRPNKPLNIGLGIVLGLFAGLCLAFLLDYLDDSILTKDKAEKRLGVPVLTTVSEKEFKGCT